MIPDWVWYISCWIWAIYVVTALKEIAHWLRRGN